jgi:hypothetical protein
MDRILGRLLRFHRFPELRQHRNSTKLKGNSINGFLPNSRRVMRMLKRTVPPLTLLILVTTIQLLILVTPAATTETADISEQKGRNIFFLLGTLDEYMGRDITDGGELVEMFYPFEHLLAYIFLAYLKQVNREQNINCEIRIEKIDQGHFRIISQEMNRLLNSFYRFAEEKGNWDHLTHLDYEPFEGRDRTLKLAYLAGAYLRYGMAMDGYRISVANTPLKALLVSRLLQEIGCEGVSTAHHPDYILSPTSVSFEPSEELMAWLERYPEQWAYDSADSLIGLATAEDLAVYRAVLSASERGAFDGCTLEAPYELSRITSSALHLPEPESPGEIFDDAVEDYLLHIMEVRSLRELAGGPVILFSFPKTMDPSRVYFYPVGYSGSKEAAVTVISYGCSLSSQLQQTVAAYMEKRDSIWHVTHYSVRRSPYHIE